VDDRRERQNIARAYGTGVGARRGHRVCIAIMLLLVLRHPTCASCVAWMRCRMSNSIKHVWACPDQSSRCGHRFSLAIMLFFVLRHPTCASCVACMCCNSIKHVWACLNQSSRREHRYLLQSCCCYLSVCPVVVDDRRERQNIARAYGTGVGARRGHWFNIAIMFLLVLRHPTCASCVARMCCMMSDSIKHVRTCPDLSLDRLGLYTFLHSLRSTSSNLCIIFCMNVLYDVRFYQACTNMSRSIIRSSFTLHLLTLFAL